MCISVVTSRLPKKVSDGVLGCMVPWLSVPGMYLVLFLVLRRGPVHDGEGGNEKGKYSGDPSPLRLQR